MNETSGSITIDEMLSGVSQAQYLGSFSDPTFSANNTGSLGETQTIAGTFSTASTFTGTYNIQAMGLVDIIFGEICEVPRGVTGVKQ